ncbi:universal stress protein [Flaviaesturariibacter flavus]|uniref:Universal stress protein n=1 Tax=Flaviaesturariibacter flavus TaxID=2502780 RepID=A0A4R1BP83_9BACT|nr:universal stress protein [Flaviaesturariibacter flavus]TCJ19146.1 universal stress protein [Flaviaesturariibacter flavus]
MKNILIPIDFSETSYETARYSARLFSGLPGVTITLYHMLHPGTHETPEVLLDTLKAEIAEQSGLKVGCHTEPGSNFPEALTRFARHCSASLIIMGFTGPERKQKLLLTGNILDVVDNNACPVMILPPGMEFHRIYNIALTSDFHNVDVTVPFGPIRQVLELFQARLHVVNVNSDMYITVDEEVQKQKQRMEELFGDFDPEFHFMNLYEFNESINQFVTDHAIDMVIIIPHKHTGVSKLFHHNSAKKLALNSTVPVVTAHE